MGMSELMGRFYATPEGKAKQAEERLRFEEYLRAEKELDRQLREAGIEPAERPVSASQSDQTRFQVARTEQELQLLQLRGDRDGERAAKLRDRLLFLRETLEVSEVLSVSEFDAWLEQRYGRIPLSGKKADSSIDDAGLVDLAGENSETDCDNETENEDGHCPVCGSNPNETGECEHLFAHAEEGISLAALAGAADCDDVYQRLTELDEDEEFVYLGLEEIRAQFPDALPSILVLENCSWGGGQPGHGGVYTFLWTQYPKTLRHECRCLIEQLVASINP
jgi:hypothetical protein